MIIIKDINSYQVTFIQSYSNITHKKVKENKLQLLRYRKTFT